MTDSCAAQLASGAVSPGQFVGVLGTTLVVKGVSTELLHDPEGSIYSHLHPDGWWLPGGASNTGGEALGGPPALAELDDAAAARGPAGCVSYPLMRTGERFPFVAPDAHGFVLGRATDQVEAYRATLEGVAFVERLAYERLAELGAVREGTVRVAGGASRSRVWNRIRATVLGDSVVVAESPTSAFGAALLAAVGTLHENLALAARAMVIEREQVDPDAAEQDAMAESYARFVGELRRRGWLHGQRTTADRTTDRVAIQGR
jgi:sugar (pentulose or hexulose) kinase